MNNEEKNLMLADIRELLENSPAGNPFLSDDFDEILLEHGFDGDPCELLHELI